MPFATTKADLQLQESISNFGKAVVPEAPAAVGGHLP